MNKKEFIERLYITEETDTGIQVTFNDTTNYNFIQLNSADPLLVLNVFHTPNPSWNDVRRLMREIRDNGTITMEMKAPVRYPIALI